MSGQFNEGGEPGATGRGFKAQKAIITTLDPQGQPTQETRVFGVWPISWKTAEFNYGTNEFHTIEVVFRYDFMEHAAADVSIGSTALAGSRPI